MNGKYYSLVQNGDVATINIYGDITSFPIFESDVSAKNLSEQLDKITNVKEIDVYINSYGGEVAEGLAIYNALKRKSKEVKVVTYCDGFACSIASVIFMGGTERKMSSASLLMIHNAWTSGQGNAAELRKLADDLDIITSASVEAYKSVATIPEEEIQKLMDTESWISPKSAIEYGFATEIVEDKAENPSQCVKKALFELITGAESAKQSDIKPNIGKKQSEDDPPKGKKKGEKENQNKEKTANELFDGFFNALLKL